MQKRHILVVDDNKVNRLLLAKILDEKFNVLQAENGKEALEILAQDALEISAILLDLVMPVMDGYEFLKQQQKNYMLSKIPVIVITQNEQEETEILALSLGAYDFLTLPYRPEIILHRISNIIKLRETAALINAVEKDSLTNVYNKDFFYTRVEKILRENPDKKYDIVCIDIEKFKIVNDLFGTQEGDNLLKHLANSVLEKITGNGICGRLAADTFVAFISHYDYYDPQWFIDGINALNEYPLNITLVLRYGIFQIDDINIPVNTMCDRAKLAIDSVKGKYDAFHAFYDTSVRDHMLAEQLITDSMKSALSSGQFVVYFQPKYDILLNQIIGAEALVRWIHPEKGFMTPGDFIPLFERNGFITDLDAFVWDTCCAKMRAWLDAGHTIVPISANLSRVDIYNPNLVDILTGILEKYHLSPKYLNLEITESAYTDNPKQLISVVKGLKEIGFKIEMDDFGTGYSSLNMLSELPIDVLKLDMRFLLSKNEKKNSENIISFIISLAKWLGLPVVSEGIETEEQVVMLRNMDCNYGQGYFFAKPLPQSEFEALMLNSTISTAGISLKQEVLPSKVDAKKIEFEQTFQFKTMLIVDDLELNRKCLGRIFADQFNIVHATNGAIAMSYLLEHKGQVDVIMLDLIMPVMDGYTFMQQIKSFAPLKDIPIIVTSQAGDDSEMRSLDLGAADFIAKPYRPEVAWQRLKNVMAQVHLQRAKNEKRHRSENDVLTGLMNRYTFEHEVNLLFTQSNTAQGALLLLNIDNFKQINDILGYHFGDKALCEVAEKLQFLFRSSDIICRLGGDEFAVFLPYSITTEELEHRLPSLLVHLHLSFSDGTHTFSTDFSIGVCLANADSTNFSNLFYNADLALNYAKRNGKKQYKFYETDMSFSQASILKNMDWLLDETHEAIFVCDINKYEVMYINRAASQMIGKTRADCIGKKCYQAIWGHSSPCPHCNVAQCNYHQFTESLMIDYRTNAENIIRGKLVEWDKHHALIQYVNKK